MNPVETLENLYVPALYLVNGRMLSPRREATESFGCVIMEERGLDKCVAVLKHK